MPSNSQADMFDENGRMVANLGQAEAMHRGSINYLQNNAEAKNRGNLMTPVMFVSKNQNVAADFYIESEAEEIYMPDHTRRKTKRYQSTTSGDMFDQEDEGIVGYAKYLHIINKINTQTDVVEPRQPELSTFLKVQEEDIDRAQL